MKKILLLTLLAITSHVSFHLNADENEPVSMQIPMQKTDNIKHVRDVERNLISCYFHPHLDCIQTLVSTDVGNLEVLVRNCSTGEIWCDIFDSASDYDMFLEISGTAGAYIVTCTTASGEIYEGFLIVE